MTSLVIRMHKMEKSEGKPMFYPHCYAHIGGGRVDNSLLIEN